MAKLQALKTDDELAAVPLNQPVLVELPSAVAFDAPDDVEGDGGIGKKATPSLPDDDGAKRLADDLVALKAQTKAANARADKADKDRLEAIRVASEREEENRRLREQSHQDETTLVKNGLTAAQAERDAALAEFERAAEAGDFKAQGLAQSKIGRAEARILHFESGAAELAERKPEPERRVEPVRQDFAASVNANHNLLSTEKDWMIRNQAAFNDPDFNKRLDTAYIGAMNQPGLVRGTPEYFDFIEVKTGLKKPEQRQQPNDDDRGEISVSAPVSRNERGSDGRPSTGKIMLTSEEREIARSLGVSDIDYAKQKMNLDTARRADPEKYR